MKQQRYLLDTCICAYILRGKYNLIGCTAVAEDMVMVTQNVKDFKNIKGIRIENWIPEKL